MSRLVTLFTGQWADLPIEELCKKANDFGYQGLELACWGDHFDVFKGSESKSYCEDKLALLDKYDLTCKAISNHLAGQLVCDPNNDSRSDGLAPKEFAGNSEEKRNWAIKSMKNAAKSAKNLGIDIVNGFTGSSIWHALYTFPPTSNEYINEGFKYFSEKWNPILDIFEENNIKFALEVHPTEIAFDIYTAEKTLEYINNRKSFGFNFDPSHLYWQMINPVKFIQKFHDRIYHVHIKDAIRTLDGESGILSSHLDFGNPKRGWDFRTPGRGDVNFEEIIRTLNQINYIGPLSVEWEDSGMNREHGAKEACKFVKELDFKKSEIEFDAAFDK